MARAARKRREEWALPEADFRRRLATEEPLPLYLLIGPERFVRGELADAIRHRVLGAAADGPGFLRIAGPQRKNDASRFDIAGLLDELRSSSLFAAQKLVLLDPADHVLDVHRDLLADYMKQISASSTLVLATESIDGRTTFAKRLKESRCLAASCRSLHDRPAPWERGRVPDHDSELTRWVVNRASSRHSKRMGLEVAHLLASLAGKELGVLASALEKLALVADGRDQIEAADVQSVTAAASGQSAFELAEAVQSRIVVEALTLVRRIFACGLETGDGRLERDPARAAPIMLASLRRGLLRFHRSRAAIQLGEQPRKALEAEGVNRFFLDGAIAQLERWSAGDLRHALEGLARLELRSKTGRMTSFEAELEGWLVHHLPAPAPRRARVRAAR